LRGRHHPHVASQTDHSLRAQLPLEGVPSSARSLRACTANIVSIKSAPARSSSSRVLRRALRDKGCHVVKAHL
jgi:hypothetical protein